MRRRSFKTVFILLFLFISFPAWSQPATVDFVQAAENSIHAVVHIQCEYEQETSFTAIFLVFTTQKQQQNHSNFRFRRNYL